MNNKFQDRISIKQKFGEPNNDNKKNKSLNVLSS